MLHGTFYFTLCCFAIRNERTSTVGRLTNMGMYDGGVKRGDRADTGDLEAQHKDGVGRKGSGVRAGDGGPSGNVTADPSSFDGGRTIGSTGKAETPSYPAVEHGDAEGYVEDQEPSKKK
jgi:hypothetical protein